MKRQTLLAVTLLLGACGNGFVDLYQPCDLEANSTNAAESACAGGEGATCAVPDPNSRCGGRRGERPLCARFQGSEPFCTENCSSDANCPGGFCDPDLNFCVSDDLS